MASKKAEFKKRSAAAKRGWATRRKKSELIKEIGKKQLIEQNVKRAVEKKPKLKRLKKKKRSVAELEALLAKKEKEIKVVMSTANWVDAMPTEYLKEDGTVALMPSRLRHLGKQTKLILKTLRKADKNGVLSEIVNELAGVLNVPIREIYTLWFSP